ncbi:hypothetical protein QOZ80_9AG0686430 [Eleusine coracana subsp. coracana]|nr:hypothetical protein QOZ80_9AG0686430 [Eleusine coracana subsp. coracana]
MAAVAPGKTASTHRAALVKATHQFDIVGYSTLKAFGRSHSIKSGSFDVSGHDWAVHCHFEGHRGLAAVSLERTRMAGDLLAAADRFQLVERMRPLCENLLCESITPETAAATLKLAERHRRPELRAFCLDYISSPGKLMAVVASDDYKDLATETLAEIINSIAANS